MPVIFTFCFSVLFTSKYHSLPLAGEIVGVVIGGTIRAIGEVSLGMFLFYLYQRINISSFSSTQINLIEILSTVFLIKYLLENGNQVTILVLIAIIIIWSAFGKGFVSCVLQTRFFQFLGNYSLSIYLLHLLILDIMIAYLPDFNKSPILGAIILWAIVIPFSFISQKIIQPNNLKRVLTYIYGKKEFLFYCICLVAVVGIYLLNGTNIWAEIVTEYQKYAQGAPLEKSFAGYLTVFPIFIGYLYYYLLSWSPISWYTFCTIVSCLYVVLCVVTILIICKRKGISKVNIACIMLALIAMIAHPFVRSLVNITHLGYIPIILYIVLSAFDGTLTRGMDQLPNLALIPLFLAVISKPSFFCLPFLLVCVSTKVYRRPLVFISLLLSSVLSGAQLFLLSSGSIGFVLGNWKGFFKFVLSFVQATGAAIYFPIKYFIDGTVSVDTIVISTVLGVFALGSLIWLWLRKKNDVSAWIQTAILFSVIAACVMPYLTLNYTSNWESIQQQVFQLCFWKHKLQYQLISSIVMVAIFAGILNKYIEIKNGDAVIRQGGYICLVLALCNGVCCGLYSGHWQTVHAIQGDGVSYTNTQNFKYAPNPDWDWSWSETMGGWTKGNQYYGYLKKPEINGGIFREKNTEAVPTVNQEQALVYLILSDPNAVGKNPTDYWEFFDRPDREYEYSFGSYTIKFSEATSNAVRYAVVPYASELVKLLVSQNYTIIKTNDENYTPLEPAYLNFCIVW